MAASARRIRINNPDLTRSEKTYLDADYSSGLTLTVKSNVSFAKNDIVVVGEPGQEGTESKAIDSLSGKGTITLKSALNFSHTKGTTVYRSEYDFADIDVDEDAAATTWTALSQSPLQWDRTETIYVHQGGASGFNYRFRFRNSQTGNTAEYSPTISGAGFGKSSAGYMVQEVRKAIIDPDGNIVSNTDILRFLNAAKDIVKGARTDWWFWRKEDSSITTVASQSRYNLDDISTTLEFIKDVRYNYDDGTRDEIWHLRHLSDVEFDFEARDNTATEDDDVSNYNIEPADDSSTAGYIRVWPIPATTARGTFHIRYYQPDAELNDVADTTTIPIPQMLVDYAIFRCEQIKGDEAKARIYKNLFFGAQYRRKGLDQSTGIALLEQMHRGKGVPIGQPRSIKRFRGRRAMRALYRDHNIDRDRLAEDWFDYPRAK